MKEFIDFIENADNVYRTKHFIVKQKVNICKSAVIGDAMMMSIDTYYARTPSRDFEYDIIFKTRGKQIEGKRIIASIYTRKYVE